ncbi:MAG TPA: biotin/lipoyl-containing protein [Candidatus Methylomirabilis sp.]|jgi:biotin carboxyl carrier protein|nr:biotin/lipoyl-containing protein [Candidatus Methylomirabilis sp.]
MAYIVSCEGKDYAVEVAREGSRYRVTLDGAPTEVDLRPMGRRLYSLLLGADSYEVDVLAEGSRVALIVSGEAYQVEVVDERERRLRQASSRAEGRAGRQEVSAPMPGKVVAVLVQVGHEVAVGQGLVVIEAMKMENELKATGAGRVAEIRAVAGKTVNGGEVLLVLE